MRFFAIRYASPEHPRIVRYRNLCVASSRVIKPDPEFNRETLMFTLVYIADNVAWNKQLRTYANEDTDKNMDLAFVTSG